MTFIFFGRKRLELQNKSSKIEKKKIWDESEVKYKF